MLPLLGEAKPLQGLEPADTQGALNRVLLLVGCHHQDAVLGAGHEGTVKAGQALLPDLVEQLLDPSTSVSGPSSSVIRDWARARTPWAM